MKRNVQKQLPALSRIQKVKLKLVKVKTDKMRKEF